MDIQIILQQMLMLFAMMVTGYFIWKKEWFDENAYLKLSKVVVNILNPLLVVNGVLGKDSGGDLSLLLQNLGFVVFFYLLLAIASFALAGALRPPKAQRRLYRLMAIFPNVGFMGIPVITSIYGAECMIYIVFYMLGYNLLLYTYGLSLAKKAAEDAVHAEGTGPGSKRDAGAGDFGAGTSPGAGEAPGKQWLRMVNPGVVFSLIAVAVFLFRLQAPAPIVSFCDYMGNATIPLSMLLIGMSIAKSDLKSIFTDARIYGFTAIKMVALPIAAVLLLKPFGADPVILGVFALQLSMPVGNIVTLIAKEYGADETTCTNGIVLSTLASILTIPLVCMFL